MSLHAATIGSINIDYIVDLSEINENDKYFLNGHIKQKIETTVGGNGPFFAEAALEAGFATSKLFTTLGGVDKSTPDSSAKMAIEYLENRKVEVVYSIDHLYQTGRTIMIYYPENRRFVVADRGAGDSFRLDNLPPKIYKLLSQVNLLYVSGYGLQKEQRNDAIQTLLRFARKKGIFTVIDIVPHQIYKSISFNKYKEFLVWANAISIEGPTLKGFLGYKNTDVSSQNDIEIIQDIVSNLCELSFVRLNTKSDFLIVTQDSRLNIQIPFPPNRAGRRFMDRILAYLLKSYLSKGRSIEDKSWVDEVLRMPNTDC